MTRADQARAACNELRRLWIEAGESERELTERPAFASLSERVLAEMRGSDG